MRPTPIRILAIALLLVAAFATGCAKKTTPVQTTPVPPAEQPQTTPTPGTPAPPTPTTPSSPTASITDLVTVYFDFDSYALSDDARAALERNAKLLRDNASWTVTIGGHCDERGTVEYNQALGEKRANAVRDFLVAAGVRNANLRTVSYGKDVPVDEGHDEAAWARNRRAEFAR